VTTASPPPLLPDVLGGRYRIEREIGFGGMARVYLARDVKHARDVAVKVIRPDLAASLARERFLREIEIAARLRHPNIVPLYDSGDADGVLYFVMPYEEGPSLRTRLDDGNALTVVERVSLLRDIARALAYAHEHGVVHRDVKPDNVMLSGGAAVVTDFGIAKAVSVAQAGAPSGTLTQGGAGIGTAAYMAPEQAVGDPSMDHRADIYSFGCLAYELFAGKPPFHDLPTHELIAAHVATTPAPVTAMCAAVPDSVARLIAKCLEKSPDSRPQSARDLVGALDDVTTTSAPVPSRRGTSRQTLSLGWAGLALALVAISTVAYWATRGPGAPISLSVLPFGNSGADSAMNFIAAELPEEVASALAKVPGIQIKSRNGARAYRGQLTMNAADVGAKLKADYLMTGVVREEGGRWILSADLERVVDGTSLWDTVFYVSPEQQLGAADAIARSVTVALRKQFPRSIGPAPVLAPNQRTANLESYRLYLRGRELLTRRVQNVKQSADLFQESIHQDTTFAWAYSGLSMALALFPYFERVPVKDVHDGIVSGARRALELDATQAEPHVARAMAYQFDRQWDSAATEFSTAIRLDGRNVEARVQYARHLRFRGRYRESLSHLRAAMAEDPASALVLSQLAYGYYLNHQMDSAQIQSARALQNDSSAVSIGQGAMILLRANRLEEAHTLAERVNRRSGFAGSATYIIARSGDTATALQRLRELDAKTPQPWMAETDRALAYLGLGDTARALSAMERATDGKEMWHVANGLFDPMYDSVRESARFKKLLARVGLTP
jgi:serine/threonine-protein kinase